MLSASTPASVPASSFSNTSKQRTLVPEIGLHVLHTPSDNIAAADIVFVHGLQGSPYKTWTWKGEVAQKRRWPRFGLGRKDDRPEESERISPEIFWPADFLYEDYPDLRILTYGYDSHVSRFFNGPANKSNLSQLGEGLLNRLSGERSRSKASKRPIIFVAHSLGGLVVKEALVESKKYEDNAMKSDIYESIKGIVFFGTPHRGSSDAQWGDILRSIASVAFDTNEKLLQTLKPDNELLAKLAKDFQDILDKESLKICSLLESSGKTGLSIFHGKVVPDFSASFNSRKYEHLDYINNNHMNMCRFTGKEDDGYQSFRTGLEFCMGDLPVTEAREGLLQSLGFENMLAREAQLREASPLTLDWLWEISDGPASIQQWLSSGTGVFWIQGKPASGKSTLMNHLKSSSKTKSALAHARTKRWVVVRFFFDFRARTGISNNFDGLLRAILYQLASDVPELAPSILDFGVVDPLQPKGQKDISWSCSQLRAALLSITSTCESNILLLIDGVDELDGVGQDVLDMIELFQALNDLDEQRRRVKVCIASRPIPMMVTAFSNSPGFSLERYNYQGIKNYVECRMQIATRSLQASQLSPDFLYSFVEPVAERSLGVFLWARFAADELLEGFSNGDDRHEMWARLDTLPDELEAIYHRITTRTVHACGSSQETSVMLQIAYFTLRPLSIKEFYVLFHTSMRRRICYKSCSLASFERKLRAKTGGLLEVTSTKVKLIHETVRAYCDRLCGARGSFFTDHEKSWAAEKLQQSSRHGLQEEEVVGNGYWVTSNRNNTACSDSVSKSFPDRNEQANSLTSDLPYPTVLNTRRTPDGSSFEKGLLALLVPVIPSSTFLPPSTENQPPGASSNTGGKDSSVTLNTGGNLKTDPKPKRRKISTFNSETIATTSLIRKTTACIRCRTQRIRCVPDASDPRGPCLTCTKVITFNQLPCLRFKLSDCKLISPGWTERDWLFWPQHWPNTKPTEVKLWPGNSTIAVDLIVTGIFCVKLPVRGFTFLDTPKEFSQVDTYALGIANVMEFASYIIECVEESITICIDRFPRQNYELERKFFELAMELNRDTMFSEFIRPVLLFWAAQIASRENWLLNLSQDTNPSLNSKNEVPLTPMIRYQIEAILHVQILAPLAEKILRATERTILESGCNKWLLSCVVLYMILHGIDLEICHRLKVPELGTYETHHDDKRLKQLEQAAWILLAYYHYSFGHISNDFLQGCTKNKDIALDLLKSIRNRFTESDRSSDPPNYDIANGFRSQMFVLNWTPGPSVVPGC